MWKWDWFAIFIGLSNFVHAGPNLIFIVADDLRVDLSPYDRSYVISPNLLNLASNGIVFERAYNQVPVCFPSRHSLLTGVRPDTLNIHTWTDTQHAYVDSLFSMLVREGKYNSAGIGKLFHNPHNHSSEFTHGRWDGSWYKYQNSEDSYLNSSVTPDSNIPEENFRDHIIASFAIDKLQELTNLYRTQKTPFVLSIGFKLPHTQYHIPRKYYDMYRDNAYLDKIMKLRPNENKFPKNAPRANYRCCAKDNFKPMINEGRNKSTERFNYYGVMRFANAHHAELLRGYLAGITFLDTQIGRVMSAVKSLDMTHDTTIVFTSDHGMHLGEKGMWEKYTLFEETTQVPLIISHPPHPQNSLLPVARRYQLPVELVDVVPTILDLLNINRVSVLCPKSKLCVDLEGLSLADIVRGSAPDSRVIYEERQFAVSQMRRCYYAKKERHFSQHPEDKFSAVCLRQNKRAGSVMGYSLRSLHWRYTCWLLFDDLSMQPVLPVVRDGTGDAVSCEHEELYAHVFYSANGHQQVDGIDFTKSESANQVGDNTVTVNEALQQHRQYLATYLRESALFSFKQATNATIAHWRQHFSAIDLKTARVQGPAPSQRQREAVRHLAFKRRKSSLVP